MLSVIAAALDPTDPAVQVAARDLAGRLDANSEVERAVMEMLVNVAEGSRVIIMRAEDEVTPAKAADMMGVTRQFVDRLCAAGVLPYRHLPGSRHRRIRVKDAAHLASEREARRVGGDVLRTATGGGPPAHAI